MFRMYAAICLASLKLKVRNLGQKKNHEQYKLGDFTVQVLDLSFFVCRPHTYIFYLENW
jgi:hypothetical protein